MTAATPTRSPVTLTLTESIVGLFRVLISGIPEGVIAVTGRTPSGIDQGFEAWVRCDTLRDDWIPVPVLTALEYDTWSLRAHVGVRETAGPRVSRVGALMVSVPLGGAPIVESERLSSFPLRPTTLIVGGEALRGADVFHLYALFALDHPITIEGPEDEARVLELHQELASAIGGVPPGDDLGALSVPLPGSLIRQARGRELATMLELDPSRVYTIDQIQAASARRK